MGILMPALQRVRKQARTVYCLSSLKQIGIAMTAYALENDDYIPRALDEHNKARWIIVFIPYLGNEYKHINNYKEVDVFQCPSFPRNGVGVNGYSNAEQTIDYVINAWDMDDPQLSNGEQGSQLDLNPDRDMATKLIEIKSPAQRIYMADNEAGEWRPVIRDEYELDMFSRLNILDVWSIAHLPLSETETSSTHLHRRVAQSRHRGDGCNNLFFDGHADWLHKDKNTSRYWCGEELP
jgi:prepilin-type processing-associated H-X9-DG protein